MRLLSLLALALSGCAGGGDPACYNYGYEDCEAGYAPDAAYWECYDADEDEYIAGYADAGC